MRKYTLAALLSLILASCGDSGRTLSSATGSIYECLIVAPATTFTQAERDHIATYSLGRTGGAYDIDVTNAQSLIDAVMSEPMPCMPQAESYFKTTCVSPAQFDDFLKPTRNILMVDINPQRYTQVRAHYETDIYSHPQALVRITAPDQSDLIPFWLENGEAIRAWFVSQEISRSMSFLRGGSNEKAREQLRKYCGVDMLIPSDYMLIKAEENLVWCCNNKGPMRKDIIVYREDYTDQSQMTLGMRIDQRDQVLGAQVSATVEGSHMGTELKYSAPQMSAIPYGVEVRGLWKMLDGEAMGGPFVSHSIVDSLGTHIVTAETFVFAPGQKKRSALRQSEAILWTMTR